MPSSAWKKRPRKRRPRRLRRNRGSRMEDRGSRIAHWRSSILSSWFSFVFVVCCFSCFEEFVDLFMVDFDLALLFVPFAGGLDERVVGQVLTLAEDSLANALALLREF